MILLLNPSTDPARNLALEEYLLTRRSEDVAMVWRNAPCVIVGRNQNLAAEINHEYLHNNNIPALRRISGGGAVYHDAGNINYSVMRTRQGPLRIDYREYLEPIIAFLSRLGITARLEDRSDLVTDAGKISGNAQHHHKQRVLHHGTLLFDTDLAALKSTLAPGHGHYTDRATASRRKPVVNLRSLLKTDISPEDFMRRLLSHFRDAHPGAVQVALSMAEQEAVQTIARQRYQSWEWNVGRSPDYTFRGRIDAPGGGLKTELSVRKGIIRKAAIQGGGLAERTAAKLTAALIGCRHAYADVRDVLQRFFTDSDAENRFIRSLLNALF